MKQIFLVDDSATILMSMESVLKKAGYGVQTYQNPLDALAALKGGAKPALMITDLNMPEMDGISLIKEARKLAHMRFVPILILTTESQQAKRQEAKKAGATGWLVKPVTAKDLLGVIRQVLPDA